MKQYILLASNPDEKINALISSTVCIEDRVKQALEYHFDVEVEIVSISDVENIPCEIEVIAKYNEEEHTFYLEALLEY